MAMIKEPAPTWVRTGRISVRIGDLAADLERRAGDDVSGFVRRAVVEALAKDGAGDGLRSVLARYLPRQAIESLDAMAHCMGEGGDEPTDQDRADLILSALYALGVSFGEVERPPAWRRTARG